MNRLVDKSSKAKMTDWVRRVADDVCTRSHTQEMKHLTKATMLIYTSIRHLLSLGPGQIRGQSSIPGCGQHHVKYDFSPSTGLQAGQHGGQGLRRQLGTFGLVLVWGKTPHYRRTAALQEGYTRLDERFLKDRKAF